MAGGTTRCGYLWTKRASYARPDWPRGAPKLLGLVSGVGRRWTGSHVYWFHAPAAGQRSYLARAEEERANQAIPHGMHTLPPEVILRS